MATKDQRLKARLPRGLADRSAAEIRATERMLKTIREVYERYGFEPVETPLFEYTDALGKFLPDQDRPNEGVFSFQDDDEQWLSLRYDLTAPLARYVAENFERLPKPYRSYRAGWVFRNEKPGPGRFRQFMQFDADTVGAASPAADAEMCMMAADTMEALGIPRGQYVIKVNSRKVLDGVMEAAGVTDERQKLTVLRAIDKLDRLGVEGVRELLGPGRKDESGDFTKGAGLGQAQIIDLLQVVGSDTKHVTPVENYSGAILEDDELTALSGKPEAVLNDLTLGEWSPILDQSKVGTDGLEELNQMAAIFASAGFGTKRVRVSPSVVRGLEYYTGPVFEADLTFEITGEDGRPVRFGSVGGGGRYDGLIGRFRGEDVPATGFSIGVSRLQAALAALGKSGAGEETGPVVVTVMERDRIADYQRMVAALRNADLRDATGNPVGAELYLGDSGMRAQLKYADRRNSPCVIIQGSDERARGVVQIKDLAAGKEIAAGISEHAAYREERPGQFEVKEAELVEEVRKLLAGRST